jgi:hypothetical protein
MSTTRGGRPPLALLGAVLAGIAVLVIGAFALVSPASAATTVRATYSPLGATANGASGPGSAAFTAAPHCCPDTAVVLTPQRAIGDAEAQWMNLGLPWDNGQITAVRVCYKVSTASPGGTYISQTRLTDMTVPTSASVVLDDGTNRAGTGGSCYNVSAAVTPQGALTLSLKVVFGSTGDRITIGMVRLTGVSA